MRVNQQGVSASAPDEHFGLETPFLGTFSDEQLWETVQSTWWLVWMGQLSRAGLSTEDDKQKFITSEMRQYFKGAQTRI